jgi:V/A-type H+/Na+-transporting ATPase subunit K
MTLGLTLSILGASLSIIGGGIGTILGTLHVGGSGASLVAAKPKFFGLVLLMTALPSSQGIYGFLGSILILQQTGFLTGEAQAITTEQGLVLLAAALPVALLGLFSGAGQGKVLQSGLRIIANNASNVGQAVILGVLMESMAVFGLLLTILIVNSSLL